MKGLRARLPILALALLVTSAVLALSFGIVGAQESATSPVGVSPQLPPVFDPRGLDNQPGAWLWSTSDGRWTFIPAQAYQQGGAVLPAAETPARPQDVAVFWVASTDTPGTYWVWNVFKFAISDVGYSSWVPRWERVTGMAFLGS